ncbi:hypothetical protein FTRO_0030210 [Fructobacillus tropaeoli]|uniref:Uncharacterized protein n=1 Tax=Fructobacillus tropaeoli TaxID=709323 RepID=A0A3F3GYB9_9LACO|nr:hypothetical protein FTRO_0030210 [Fructobacillus tropaeoli]
MVLVADDVDDGAIELLEFELVLSLLILLVVDDTAEEVETELDEVIDSFEV